MSYAPEAPLALNDVSFEIEEGEFVFIIGQSGSGKSTIVKLLTCEERPNSGRILIDDLDLTRLRPGLVPYLRRSIGMVFQDFRLIPTMTVFDNVAFAMEILGESNRHIRRQVSMVLSTVGLRAREKARPDELSGGEQQRVGIARAMVNNPGMLLADEPTGNLDPATSESIMALLEEINHNGTTVIVCTHDQEMVNRMQKRVIEIADGRLVRDAHRALYSDLDNNLLDLAGGRQALDETFGSEELFAEMAAIRNGEASPSQPAEEAGAAEKERRGFTSYDFYYKRR
ncbi:MAG: cell division ATP-binding protein FtsE [Bacillota bacterium]|nr:cell division ATP-binding protein FtsE [Bacillota bacterium]